MEKGRDVLRKGDRKRHSMDRALEQELRYVSRQEERLAREAGRTPKLDWKGRLEEKVPEKVERSLQAAFSKAFRIVFEQGRSVIEKTYDREELQKDYEIADYAVSVKGTRKELKQMRRSAGSSELKNLAVTTVEGVGLGALGVGLPDIVLFTGFILKGVYETALHYGYDYTGPEQQLLILTMLETALLKGEDWQEGDARVNAMLAGGASPAGGASLTGEACTDRPEKVGEGLQVQLERTAKAFAMDMLLLKFIQGLPLVGMVGGAGNPVYYHRIMRYVTLKYHRKYVQDRLRREVGSRGPESDPGPRKA